MLAGRLDEAAALLPESLVDHYAIAGEPDECAAKIAAMGPHCDLFVVPMNDIAGSATHIRRSADILRQVSRPARSRVPDRGVTALSGIAA